MNGPWPLRVLAGVMGLLLAGLLVMVIEHFDGHPGRVEESVEKLDGRLIPALADIAVICHVLEIECVTRDGGGR